jgi:mono/diheme cytochrome c family protein
MRFKRLTAAVLVLASTGCSWPGRALRGFAKAEPTGLEALEEGGAFHEAPRALRGQVRFVFDGFGSLTTDELDNYAMPWKLTSAALVRARHERTGDPLSRSTLAAAMAERGFVSPRRIANWVGPQPRLERPLGVVAGLASRSFPGIEVEVANLGCATCHAAPLYGRDGLPTGDAWLGLPNASIDLSAYADDALAALTRELERPDTLLATVLALYPETSEREIATLRKHVIPGARKQLAERTERYGGLLPFENGGPGLMNGVGSLRFLVGAVSHDVRQVEIAWASAPELSGTTLRRALLVDGVYAPPGSSRFGPMSRAEVTSEHMDGIAGVASLFVSGTQGVAPEAARTQVSSVRDIIELVHEMRPPRFPGAIDRRLAERGRDVYESACAACHGVYSSDLDDARLVTHPNRLVAQDRMLTDKVRWATVDSAALRLMSGIGYGDLIDAAQSNGYVAPDLSGVWATAPYLHNGSVPTLWHLLHAEERPTRFYVGGHALDYGTVGIAGSVRENGVYAYPEHYVPWSRAKLYDTTEPGRSNAGHEFRTLSEAEKRALLEYMKVL